MNQKYHVEWWTEAAGFEIDFDNLEEAVQEYNKLKVKSINKIVRLTQTLLLDNQIDGEFIE